MELLSASMYFDRLNKAVSESDSSGISYYSNKIISKCSKASVVNEISVDMFEYIEDVLLKIQRVIQTKDQKFFLSLLPAYSKNLIYEKGQDSFLRKSFNEALIELSPIFSFKKPSNSIEFVKAELDEIIEEVRKEKFNVEDIDFFLEGLFIQINNFANSLPGLSDEQAKVCQAYYPALVKKYILEARKLLTVKRLDYSNILQNLTQASSSLLEWSSIVDNLQGLGKTFLTEQSELLMNALGIKKESSSSPSSSFLGKTTKSSKNFSQKERDVAFFKYLIDSNEPVEKVWLAKKESIDVSTINSKIILLNKRYGQATIQIHKVKQAGRRGPAIALYSLTDFGKETYYKLREELDAEPSKDIAG